MKTKLALGLALLALSMGIVTAAPLGAAFTYQAKLSSGTNAANGSYDFMFSLYDAATNGNYVAGLLTNGLPVTEGSFAVSLDFGPTAFNGDARWLQIQVCSNLLGHYTTLWPRQPVTAAPYALHSKTAAQATSAGSATTASSVTANAVTSAGIASGQVVKSLNSLKDAVSLAAGENLTLTPSGQTLTLALNPTNLAGVFSGDGSGLTNLNVPALNPYTALLNTNQTFSGSNTFAGVLTATNATNLLVGTFLGDGAGLTNLNVPAPSPYTALLNTNQTFTATNTFVGVVVATNTTNQITGTFTGSGSGLTGLSASQLSSGTVPLAQLPGAVVTNNATGIILSGSFSGNGAGLTNLNVPAPSPYTALLNTNQTFTGSNIFVGVVVATNTTNQITGTFTGSGSGITDLSASQLSSGTVPLAQLPGTVITNHATGITLSGTFSGSGAGLTKLNADLLDGQHGSFYQNATNLNAGTLSLAVLPGAVVTNNATGVNLTGTFSGNGAGVTNVNLMAVNEPGRHHVGRRTAALSCSPPRRAWATARLRSRRRMSTGMASWI